MLVTSREVLLPWQHSPSEDSMNFEMAEGSPQQESARLERSFNITRREWFAGMAMNALMARGNCAQPRELAKAAFKMANEMEREAARPS